MKVQCVPPRARIGIDESGKGDYFGPLVIAAVYVDPHAVVVIAPPRYNELYAKIQHLNRLLAWGHARALENVLKQVDCQVALADQFGDASFLQHALLQKGRRITLQQRPRAEEDIAVAAASILARVEFVWRLGQLGRSVGHILPKGSSDPAIITIRKGACDSRRATGAGAGRKTAFSRQQGQFSPLLV